MTTGPIRGLLALSAALTLVLVGSRFLSGAMQPVAQLHPDADSLLQSAGWLAGRPDVLWLGYALGLLVIAIMGTGVWIGLRKHDAGTPLSRWIMIGFAAYALLFTCLTVSSAAYAGNPSGTAFFGGFPLPTALMLYGMWQLPLLSIGLYMVWFDRWVLTDEDLARFRKLVDEARRQGGAT